MKKLIIIFATLTLHFALSTLNGFAQPNPGFENWSTVFNLQEPDNWQTWNFAALTTPPNPISSFKATGLDKHSGNYALKLKTVFLNNNPTPNSPDSMGLVFSGKISYNPVAVKYGFPYTGRPEKLEFWAKYQPVGNDSGAVGIFLKKWNGLSSDTIAYGAIRFAAVAQFTLFQLNLFYKSSELPDSATIGIASSKSDHTARVGSILCIDDLALTGWVGIDESNSCLNDKTRVFPNPAKDNVNINTEIEEANNLKVIDFSGKLAGIYPIKDHFASINTSTFAEGVYLYEVSDKKNAVLTKGKFTIVK